MSTQEQHKCRNELRKKEKYFTGFFCQTVCAVPVSWCTPRALPSVTAWTTVPAKNPPCVFSSAAAGAVERVPKIPSWLVLEDRKQFNHKRRRAD